MYSIVDQQIFDIIDALSEGLLAVLAREAFESTFTK
jgi:hypothetical protein